MLSSKNRIKRKIDFVRSEIDGSLYQSKSFGVSVYDRKDNLNSRFGFIISTKISKRAVIRNKIKRIISEVIRQNLSKIKKGLDVIFLIKPSIVKLAKKEIEDEVIKIITLYL